MAKFKARLVVEFTYEADGDSYPNPDPAAMAECDREAFLDDLEVFMDVAGSKGSIRY